MSRLKALQILSSLTKDEFSKFSQFIISPYFNRSKDIVKLFNCVKSYYPDFEDSKIKFEKIYLKLYPGKNYNEGTIRNLFSDMGNLAERYLSFCVYENCFFYRYNLLIEYNDRRLDKLFEKTYEKFYEEELNCIDYTGQKDLYLFLMEGEKKTRSLRQNVEHKSEPQFSPYESLMIYTLKQFFASEYDSAALLNNHNFKHPLNIVSKFFENTNIDALFKIIKQSSKDIRILELDYHLYKAFRNAGGEYFEELKKATEILYSLDNETSLGEKFSFYTKISNLANKFMNSDDAELKKFMFILKKNSAERGITTEQLNGKLRVIEFILIADSALNVHEIDWAENFIEEKIKSVAAEQRDDLYNFYKARILFERGEFEKSNEFLSKVNSESKFFKMDLKMHRMKTFYELNFIEECFSQAEAFGQYLKRSSEISEKRGKSFLNFLKFYRELLKIKSGNKADLENLIKCINDCKAVRSKKWLIAKAEEQSKK